MSEGTRDIKKVELQLKQLVGCIVDKAEQDPEFLVRLSRILRVEPSKDHEPDRARKTDFNAVEFLHARGPDALRRELHLKTDTELKEILAREGVKKQKGQKQLDREEAIFSILNHADRRLGQGGAFLQGGTASAKSTEAPPMERPTEEHR